MIQRIAVVGAGAMGTLLGACLRRAGLDVDLIDVNQAHLDRLNQSGAAVVGKVSFCVPVRAMRPEEMEGQYDLILLLTKQTFNQISFPQILPHLSAEGTIVTMQNGLPESAVAEVFGQERTMGCAVTWAATQMGPGVTCAQSDPDMWNNSLGRLDGAITDRGREVRDILSCMCRTELSDNLAGIRWSKLIINCSFSGMSAALGCTFGQVLDHPEALRCAQNIARECIAVCRASGIELHPIGPEGRLDALMDFETEEQRLATFGIYRKLFGSCRDGKASMLQDLEKGQKTEILHINGVLSRQGRSVGVPTPFCDTVISLVQKAEGDGSVPNMENLRQFSTLLLR